MAPMIQRTGNKNQSKLSWEMGCKQLVCSLSAGMKSLARSSTPQTLGHMASIYQICSKMAFLLLTQAQHHSCLLCDECVHYFIAFDRCFILSGTTETVIYIIVLTCGWNTFQHIHKGTHAHTHECKLIETMVTGESKFTARITINKKLSKKFISYLSKSSFPRQKQPVFK